MESKFILITFKLVLILGLFSNAFQLCRLYSVRFRDYSEWWIGKDV